MKRNDKGVPVYESEHEHGTYVLVNHTPNGIQQVDEMDGDDVETLGLGGPVGKGQYFTVIPMPMEVH